MKTPAAPADPLAATLASKATAAIVRFFAVNPDASPHVRRLQRATGLSSASVTNELRRLASLRILTRHVHRARATYTLNERHLAWPHLRALVRHMSTPDQVLRYVIADTEGVEDAFIFGSYAKGTAVEASDVDLFVITRGPADDDLNRHTLEAGLLLGREIDTYQVLETDLIHSTNLHRFVSDVLARPKLWLTKPVPLHRDRPTRTERRRHGRVAPDPATARQPRSRAGPAGPGPTTVRRRVWT